MLEFVLVFVSVLNCTPQINRLNLDVTTVDDAVPSILGLLHLARASLANLPVAV